MACERKPLPARSCAVEATAFFSRTTSGDSDDHLVERLGSNCPGAAGDELLHGAAEWHDFAMTLLVARIEERVIWMVADTAISSKLRDIRKRVDHLKIVRVSGVALAGFAGDERAGTDILEGLRTLDQGEAVVAWIAKYQLEHPTSQVEIAYGWFSGAEPNLVRVFEGRIERLSLLHLGDTNAFSRLQALKDEADFAYPPDSLSLWAHYCEGKAGRVPSGMSATIQAMQGLFSQTGERHVGGIVVPYLIDGLEPMRCGYIHSVTDPVRSSLIPGDIVRHGSSERGGFGVSVYELEEMDGIVVYWPQAKLGSILVGVGDNCSVDQLPGEPDAFVDSVKTLFGRAVHVGFGNAGLVGDRTVSKLRDSQGRAILSATTTDGAFAFTWIGESNEPFRVTDTLQLTQREPDGQRILNMAEHKISMTLSESLKDASIVIDGSSGRVEMSADAGELDRFIGALSHIRMGMQDAVPLVLPKGTKVALVPDPAWRSDISFSLEGNGVALVLRHPGLGWQGFLLPANEAAAMGAFLSQAGGVLTKTGEPKGSD